MIIELYILTINKRLVYFFSTGVTVGGALHLLATAMLRVAILRADITAEAFVPRLLRRQVATPPTTIPTATPVTSPTTT
jgi:hypothetical protein